MDQPGFIKQHGTKIGAGVVVILVIVIVMSYFSGKPKEEQMVVEEEPKLSDEEVKRIQVEAKFKNQVVDPSLKVLDTASKLSFNSLDTNKDEILTTDEIPDGDLKKEIFGYDVNNDSTIDMDEYKEYFKNRKK